MLTWNKWLHKNFNLSLEITNTHSPLNYFKTIAIAASASIIVFLLEHFTYEQFSNITSLFIVSVLYSSIYYGIGPAILNALLCTSVYEYFFIPPFFNFGPHGIDNIIKFVTFVMAAIITNILSVKIRNYALDLKEREERISMLHELSEHIADASSIAEVVNTVDIKVKKMLNVSSKIYLSASPAFALFAGNNRYTKFIEHVLAEGTPTGKTTKYFSDSDSLFIPLKTGRGIIGIMHVTDLASKPVKKNFKDIIEVLAAQVALSIERIMLHKENERVLVEKERESLRSALLSSLSHDLKTPLASIIGSASMLKLPNPQMTADGRLTLITTIEDEACRLHRFIINLLEITRLESGTTIPNCTPLNLDDIIDVVLKRMRMLLNHHNIQLALADELPLINLDMTLMQHVFMNLLENAVKYSESGTRIDIRGRIEGAHFIIEVEDEGRGIATEDLERVFDKFYRVKHMDSQIAGTGLGLSICHSIISAHGGSITILIPEKKRGTLVRIMFPLHRTVALLPTHEIDKGDAQ